MDNGNGLELIGIDGGNPLGFLAAVGTLLLARGFEPGARLLWRPLAGAWRPVLAGCAGAPQGFPEQLAQALASASTGHFEIDKRLPFGAEKLRSALADARGRAAPGRRRTVDFLAALGSETVHDKGVFGDTPLRMVRSGDAAGQGLPHYALEIRKATGPAELRRALFEPWDYRDDGFGLRWDPLEDQRYALRWKNPGKSSPADGPGTMSGANALALEALPLLPCVGRAGRLQATGFHRDRQRRLFFTWPIGKGPSIPTCCVPCWRWRSCGRTGRRATYWRGGASSRFTAARGLPRISTTAISRPHFPRDRDMGWACGVGARVPQKMGMKYSSRPGTAALASRRNARTPSGGGIPVGSRICKRLYTLGICIFGIGSTVSARPFVEGPRIPGDFPFRAIALPWRGFPRQQGLGLIEAIQRPLGTGPRRRFPRQ
ncbi:type I-G CRISPR-associated protein, Cas3-extension family [Methylomagnum ishizawai]|uniref:type I-G CRISPR-associated protein, Cas3-extension family n=1 Tax=Methylomagnum ishizawai TaxID=1760988 RepID=UPI001C33F4B1|nr:hypothetical protein [Methylomagnum ishizawai]BBL77194.1 hypothetical protein MishRS11D_42920 [Methylomagnum ishizawai]